MSRDVHQIVLSRDGWASISFVRHFLGLLISISHILCVKENLVSGGFPVKVLNSKQNFSGALLLATIVESEFVRRLVENPSFYQVTTRVLLIILLQVRMVQRVKVN